MSLFRCVLSVLFVGCLGTCFSPSMASAQGEPFATFDRVKARLAKGDVEALTEVKALPGDTAISGLVRFFRENHEVPQPTAKQKEIATRAAVLLTEAPTAEEYIKRLYKKVEDRPNSPQLVRQRTTVLQCLVIARNRFAVGQLVELLEESNLEVPVSQFVAALGQMNLPGAPFGNTNANPATVASWETWWKANQGNVPK
ncbi:hypothetical protein [Verrucomicrobium sp. BvORR106]|uniref:hypothetical protein n=1 Tax=Verrucomicrobium sp. BvORR106 TaxID=1403819 RepID=UPI002240F053|nr:hypothetical protein [Verrucomicrobium sp. BvORR106]